MGTFIRDAIGMSDYPQNLVAFRHIVEITSQVILQVVVLTACLTQNIKHPNLRQLFTTSPFRGGKQRNQNPNAEPQCLHTQSAQKEPFPKHKPTLSTRVQDRICSQDCISQKSSTQGLSNLPNLGKSCFARQSTELHDCVCPPESKPRGKSCLARQSTELHECVCPLESKPRGKSCLARQSTELHECVCPPESKPRAALRPGNLKSLPSRIVSGSRSRKSFSRTGDIPSTRKPSPTRTTNESTGSTSDLLNGEQNRSTLKKQIDRPSIHSQRAISTNAIAGGTRPRSDIRPAKSLLISPSQLSPHVSRIHSPVYSFCNRRSNPGQSADAINRRAVFRGTTTNKRLKSLKSLTKSSTKVEKNLNENPRSSTTTRESKSDARSPVGTGVPSLGLETISILGTLRSRSKSSPSDVPNSTSGRAASPHVGGTKPKNIALAHSRKGKRTKRRRTLNNTPSISGNIFQLAQQSSSSLGVKLTAAGQHGFLRNASTGTDSPETSFTIINVIPSDIMLPHEAKNTRTVGTSITDTNLLKNTRLPRHTNHRSVYVQVDPFDKSPCDAKTLFQKLLPRTNALANSRNKQTACQSPYGCYIDIYKVQSFLSGSQSQSSHNNSDRQTYVDVQYHAEKVKATVKASNVRSNSSNATSLFSSIDGDALPKQGSSFRHSNTTDSRSTPKSKLSQTTKPSP